VSTALGSTVGVVVGAGVLDKLNVGVSVAVADGVGVWLARTVAVGVLTTVGTTVGAGGGCYGPRLRETPGRSAGAQPFQHASATSPRVYGIAIPTVQAVEQIENRDPVDGTGRGAPQGMMQTGGRCSGRPPVHEEKRR
jgi:hypothetical protein